MRSTGSTASSRNPFTPRSRTFASTLCSGREWGRAPRHCLCRISPASAPPRGRDCSADPCATASAPFTGSISTPRPSWRASCGDRRASSTSRPTKRLSPRLLAAPAAHRASRTDCCAALAMLDIDDIGLEPLDRRLLETLIKKFKGGPVGLDTIAMSLAEEPETIEDVHEPYLIQIGFMARTARGRVATDLAYEHLGVEPPQGQARLL